MELSPTCKKCDNSKQGCLGILGMDAFTTWNTPVWNTDSFSVDNYRIPESESDCMSFVKIKKEED
jgi:hypothetical protein